MTQVKTPVVAAAVFAAALAALSPAGIATAAAPAQPNILFIFTDDLTCQALSTYGEKRHLLETPRIDQIAREGMRFDRCLVTNSICGPSRATILTGKYSHRNGFYNNSNSRFDGNQTTFPKMLQAAGYSTAIIGKWHLISDPTGFDHWHILPGQGIYYNPPMIRNGNKVHHHGYTSDVITDLSLDWLKQRDRSKPFLLMCQHKAPHREWSPALRHLGWDGDRIHPEPETLFDDFAGRSMAVRDHDMGLDRTFTPLDAKLTPPPNMTGEQLAAWNAYYEPRNQAFLAANPDGKELVRWRYNRYMHDYLACVKAVDESVGRLLDFLDEEGLAENTVVVFSSDQGFYLGEHGWFDKRWIFEESLRTPLIVRWPKVIQPGSTDGHIVSLLDFAETFLDLAGLKIPQDMQGRSLVPLLAGKPPADWRKSLYYHYYEFPVPHRVRPHYGVVTDRYKLVHYYKPDLDDWELLDRQADPLETRDYYRDPAYAQTVKELHAELSRLQKEAGDTQEPPRAAYGNKPFDQDSAAVKPRRRRPNILFAFADDWGRIAGAYAETDGPGTLCDAVKTPNFDRVAREGVLFRRAFVSAPSCTPCRGAILSGQHFWRTSRSAILSGAVWDDSTASFPLLLRDAGYHIGETYKVWSPGRPVDAPFGGGKYAYEKAGGRFNRFSQHVTAMVSGGMSVDEAKEALYKEVLDNFDGFLADRRPEQPFCYWFGPTNVHRKWVAGSGKSLWGIDPDRLRGKLPPYLPDVPEVREDLADYFGEVQAFDAALGRILKRLEETGELENTLVVVSGDHGPPGFPHGKCNLYDFGSSVSLAIRWGAAPGSRVVDDLVSLIDLAPTFLELARVAIPESMTGRSLAGLLRSNRSGQVDPERTAVYIGRERHVDSARADFLPYPQRAIRTADFLYIINFKPDRWPLGDPYRLESDSPPSAAELTHVTRATLPDEDAGPTKAWLVGQRDDPQWQDHFAWVYGKRPREELYDLRSDPHQVKNVAGEAGYADVQRELERKLLDELCRTGDPRLIDDGRFFETPPVAGPAMPPPHIILVMADDMGWGETSYHDHPLLHTPNLDAMAANGLRLDRFYAGAPVCSPTRATVLTGRSSDRYGVLQAGYPLRLQEKTVAQALQNAGYVTGHFGKWHLNGLRGPGVPVLGTDKRHPGRFGFDEWVSATNYFDLDPLLSRQGAIEPFTGDSSEITVNLALSFIERHCHGQRPIFAVIWYGSPHEPFRASVEDRTAFASLDERSQHHYGELAAMDRSLGTLRRRLRELGLDENTLLVFCSDNGGLPKIEPSTVGGLRGFKGSVYEGGLRVPAVIEWPAVVQPGRVALFPASTLDLFPTLAKIVGLPPSATLQPLDGVSLLPLLSGEVGQRDKPLAFRYRDRAALIDNRYKLLTEDVKSDAFQLFDLETDPAETRDLSAERPEVAQRMRERLLEWNESVEASREGQDYAEGRLAEADSGSRAWWETPEYAEYLSQWRDRPEYRRVLQDAAKESP